MTRVLRLGTRGSPLAKVQAHAVSDRLRERGVETTIVIIKTEGDHLAERGPQAAVAAGTDGKRMFVKEIQDALLAGTIDLAVHSSKDMPAVSPDGLRIVATLPREDPRDAVILAASAAGAVLDAHAPLASLGTAPRIGTSSVRRIAQLRGVVPDAVFLPIRGNLGTRLQKLDAGHYDALVLAAAGLRRLGQQSRISGTLLVAICVPAPGQGIVAVEARTGDRDAIDAVAPIGDHASAVALTAEQAVVRRLDGGCQMPIGAYAEVDGETITLQCVVISPDGTSAARTVTRGAMAAPAEVGFEAATELLARGAAEILARVQRERTSSARGGT